MTNPSASPSSLVSGGKVGTALAIYEIANKIHTQTREFWRNHFSYSVSVSERDPLYSDIHAWLLSIMPTERHRSLQVSSGDRRRAAFEDSEEPSNPQGVRKPLTIKFDDSAERQVDISGHKIRVWLSTPETPASGTNYEPDPKKIKFQATSYEGQQAVISELNRIHSEKATVRKPNLKMVSQWGDWCTRSDLPPRTLESVAIPEEQKKRIMADLERFLTAEDRYNRLAIPWHRGYMFHGPPGTGKTSLVKALANHFNMDLWYIGLADLKSENSLMNLIGNVGSRSILLLEDIDTVKITQDRDSSEQGTISVGSLLNSLDGVATPHGLVTMMTTNRFDVLDPALTRAGRMDMVEEIGYPSKGTIAQLFRHYYGRFPNWSYDTNSGKPIEGLSTAQVSEIFKQYMLDPEAAEEAVLTLL